MKVCIAQNVSLSDHLALSTYLRSICKYLARQNGVDLTLVVQRGSRVPDDLPQGIDIHEIDAGLYSVQGNVKYAVGLYRKLLELKRKQDLDIIHCLYPNSSVLPAALFKRKAPKTKIIYDVRSPWIEMSIVRGSIPRLAVPLYRKAAYLVEKLLLRYVDGFIFITEGLKRFYERKLRVDSTLSYIIPSGVDLALFTRKDPTAIRHKYQLTSADFVIGYVGTIAKARQLDFVLQAFEAIASGDANIKLMFVGDGDDKGRLERMALGLKTQGKVIFTGVVPYQQVPYYVSAMDVGICHLPDKFAFRSSFPMKVLEYLACQVAVVASDIQAHREIKSRVRNMHIYTNEVGSLEKAVRAAQAKSSGGFLEESLTHFGWERICEDILRLYTSVAGNNYN